MIRVFVLACAVAMPALVAATQSTGSLQIRAALIDPVHGSIPVARHALLISDNPATAEPRRITTSADGTAVVKLRPGSYIVESDRPVALQGKAYQWTQVVDIVDGRTTTLELTAANAEVGTVSTEAPAASASPSDSSSLATQWQDSVVALWTPTLRASGSVVDRRGLIVTSYRAIGGATSVEAQITPTVKVAASVLVSDQARDVAVLRIAPAAITYVKPLPLECGRAEKPTIANGQAIFTIGVPLDGEKVLESGDADRVTALTMAADFALEFGVAGGPVFTSGGDVIGIAAPPYERNDGSGLDARIVRLDPICEALVRAISQLATASPPPAAPLPVEQARPYSEDALRLAAERRTGAVAPYAIAGSEFDIALVTPVLLYAARDAAQRTRTGEFVRPLQDFANWSEYVATFPPVLLIRVTPKLVEGFWTKVGRAAAQTQGVSLPPIKRFTSGFLRMRAFCGEAEITPIHPFKLVHRLSETDAITEGLYAFEPSAFAPACGTVKLELYSEKAPQKPDTRTLDVKLLEQVGRDFALVKSTAAMPARSGTERTAGCPEEPQRGLDVRDVKHGPGEPVGHDIPLQSVDIARASRWWRSASRSKSCPDGSRR